jgi:hypothetical protein
VLLFILLGALLGAAAIILIQQWYRGDLVEGAPRTLPPASVVRPNGIATSRAEGEDVAFPRAA